MDYGMPSVATSEMMTVAVRKVDWYRFLALEKLCKILVAGKFESFFVRQVKGILEQDDLETLKRYVCKDGEVE